MGARHRAQKRAEHGNQKSSGSKSRGSRNDTVPISRSFIRGSQNQSYSTSPSIPPGLSMKEEARNTERHTSGWGSTNLRGTGVTFVSAGNLHREEDSVEDDTSKLENHNDPEPGAEGYVPSESEPIPSASADVLASAEFDGTEDAENRQREANSRNPASDSDIPKTIHHSNRKFSASSSSTSSSSEVIVFSGRRKISPTRTIQPNDINSNQLSVSQSVSKTSTKAFEVDNVKSNSTPIMTSQTSLHSRSVNKVEKRDQFSLRSKKAGVPSTLSDDENALMEDYIANMAVEDSEEDFEIHSTKRTQHYRHYHGAGKENAKVQVKARNAPSNKKKKELPATWNSDDLNDFNDLSTTDEEILDIGRVMRRRYRSSGPQYLVAGVGKTVSDARWVLRERLTSKTAQTEIRKFEQNRDLSVEQDSVSSDSSTDLNEKDELDDDMDQAESEEEENVRIMQHTSRMTDEQIARALAKQEELGMGGDDVLLFDGEFGEDDMDDDDEFMLNGDFIPFSTKKHTSNHGRSKRNRRARDSFPPAAALADSLEEDPYSGFDIMDFDRPSLRPRRKGRKSDFPFDLEIEDDELKEQLYQTWTRDRAKKASRKREKEDARLAEFFESAIRSEPATIKAEIRRFLVSDTATLTLAPMDSNFRAAVHRLAKSLILKSRSEGKEGRGMGRYPVLTKTAHTPQYTVETIGQVDVLMNSRKFFPKHLDYRIPKSARDIGVSNRARSGGGGVLSGAILKNGEIVGASAPELGADNKGRAMLEKMGWKSGMAIGAIGNKGRLESIQHVVKTTKAGLG